MGGQKHAIRRRSGKNAHIPEMDVSQSDRLDLLIGIHHVQCGRASELFHLMFREKGEEGEIPGMACAVHRKIDDTGKSPGRKDTESWSRGCAAKFD
jgi:hypothetical protein